MTVNNKSQTQEAQKRPPSNHVIDKMSFHSFSIRTICTCSVLSVVLLLSVWINAQNEPLSDFFFQLYPELQLTEEEQKLLNQEGVSLPSNLPLTKVRTLNTAALTLSSALVSGMCTNRHHFICVQGHQAYYQAIRRQNEAVWVFFYLNVPNEGLSQVYLMLLWRVCCDSL